MDSRSTLIQAQERRCSPEANKSYRVLSIDPGSRKGLGICVSAIENDSMHVEHVATINLLAICKQEGTVDTISYRVEVLKRAIRGLSLAWGVSGIVCENCYFSGMPQAYKALLLTIAAIEDVSTELFGVASLIKIEPSKVKACLGVAGNTGDKLMIKDAILNIKDGTLQLPPLEIYRGLDEHAVDAIAIGYALHSWRLKNEYSKAFDDPWGYRT